MNYIHKNVISIFLLAGIIFISNLKSTENVENSPLDDNAVYEFPVNPQGNPIIHSGHTVYTQHQIRELNKLAEQFYIELKQPKDNTEAISLKYNDKNSFSNDSSAEIAHRMNCFDLNKADDPDAYEFLDTDAELNLEASTSDSRNTMKILLLGTGVLSTLGGYLIFKNLISSDK